VATAIFWRTKITHSARENKKHDRTGKHWSRRRKSITNNRTNVWVSWVYSSVDLNEFSKQGEADMIDKLEQQRYLQPSMNITQENEHRE
jgi:hypothetical protein